MSVDVYLTFNGRCREAVEFYAKVFDSDDLYIMTFGEAPPNPEHPIPEEAKDRIMHASLTIEGSKVMFSDTFPGMDFILGNNISLSIASSDEERLRTIFNRLKEGGKVDMELQETFWSKCYGKLTDQFGIEWQLNFDERK